MLNPPVDVLWIARYDYRPGWSLSMHRHDYFQLILFVDGKGQFTMGDRQFPIRGGEAFLIRSGEMHGLSAESMVRTLDVKFRVAPGSLARDLRAVPATLNWDEPGLAARLERIRAEGEQKPPYYRELCGTLLAEILYLYLRHDTKAARPAEPVDDSALAVHDPILVRALACIRANYMTQLTVRAIAKEAGCTERTLRLHFHSILQTQPLAFLQRFRVAKAKTLIQYSDYALKEIAEHSGFQTVNHFTRHFTAVEGRSPAAWRRAYLDGIRKDVYINPKFENRILTVGE